MRNFIVFCLLFFFCQLLPAQSSSNDGEMPSLHFDMSEFPQWARDLRRAEIVAFGSFPFSFFLINFSYDLIRLATNDWNSLYAPWPFKPAGAIEQTNNEKYWVIGIAAAASIVIAVVDFYIEFTKRNRAVQNR